MLDSNAEKTPEPKDQPELETGVKDIDDRPQELSDIEDNDDILERFIPISEEDIINELSASSVWQEGQGQTFKRICDMFVALYHARFHHNLRDLKSSYLPFSPDRDTVIVKTITEEERVRLLGQLMNNLEGICERANFEELGSEELNEAMTMSSPYGVEVAVDMEDFEKVLMFYRGTAVRHTKVRNWKWLWLRKKNVETPIFRRLFVALKPNEEQVGMQNNKDVDCRSVYLKLFKNIPKYDLEMLFPNSQVKMSTFDKIKLSITGGGGTIAGTAAFAAKATLITVNFWAFLVALGGFLAVLWRQIANVFSHRTKYMANLAKNLYFYNLNNNMGAVSQLIDMAEGEDTKEAILAYYFLLAFPESSFNEASLDAAIEKHILDSYGVAVDFEVSDGLRKLRDLDLLHTAADGTLSVKGLDETLKILNDEWDEMYDYK